MVTPAGQVTAPVAPGRMGQALDPTAAQVYIDELGRWRDGRRRELDELDKAALRAATGSSATGDILLSMALWKAVSDRYELLLATWNSGRVGATELTRIVDADLGTAGCQHSVRALGVAARGMPTVRRSAVTASRQART